MNVKKILFLVLVLTTSSSVFAGSVLNEVWGSGDSVFAGSFTTINEIVTEVVLVVTTNPGIIGRLVTIVIIAGMGLVAAKKSSDET
ncbi:MAG: hypothetical protein GON13_00540, partial [Nanoarchaeota archaeon]|nr:hypothetical protein [Nanoarchaeota archaeon]